MIRHGLTGLANRRRFERVREALATGTPQVAVLDIAAFKDVNDRLGHAAGSSPASTSYCSVRTSG